MKKREEIVSVQCSYGNWIEIINLRRAEYNVWWSIYLKN